MALRDRERNARRLVAVPLQDPSTSMKDTISSSELLNFWASGHFQLRWLFEVSKLLYDEMRQLN